MAWHETERQALAETFRATDPDAPTLCEGWDARHLLGHLVQREHSPASSLGDLVTRRQPGEEKFLGRLVDGARSPAGYEALIQRFEAGPPRWSPLSWAGESISLVEYVVHHEDLRRGSGARQPRTIPQGQADALWNRLRLLVRLGLRRSPVGVTLAVPDGPRQVVRTGMGSVVLTGEPVELALYVSGRRSAANVQVTGTPEDVASFSSWATPT
jgi:uncharacterized protein (TIGR03085 family)